MEQMTQTALCRLDELMPNIGSIVLIEGEQVALFFVPDHGVYAVQDWDPIGQAYVMSRGIVGDIDGELCIASPLYKQHFSLITGQCFENDQVCLKVWPVGVNEDGRVCLYSSYLKFQRC
ncbi:nitrite reductase small subunit NirD [Vibrio sp. SM6]|uniref:Nitrite reductase small subunit NirD n=1 Tax=Vibrio agarilyticus TaxID=2726741 RepID=A0A7X8TTN6_9VIBR|nr:nitrite reductase small subunit NirD [Vibrio agarilyticus]NLS14712.1 nitrite reductase small subunit NirD [Vibrio agarilyticus]